MYKTSTGEYVSSVYIEQALVHNGWFEHALVVAENKPYVVALLFIEHEWLGRLAIKMHSTPLKVLETDAFKSKVAMFITKLNKKLNHWEKVRDYKVIFHTLTIEEGHLTPSMKLAKKFLMESYKETIDEMYKDHV